MILIRSARACDALALGDLHAASWRHAYRNALSDTFLAGDIVTARRALWISRLGEPAPHQHVLIAQRGSEMLGFACVYGDADVLWGTFLNNLHVGPAHQRLGVGTALLRACARLCAKRCAHRGLHLMVLRSNADARRFYLRHGAQKHGESAWHAPDGGVLPLDHLAWKDVGQLCARLS